MDQNYPLELNNITEADLPIAEEVSEAAINGVPEVHFPLIIFTIALLKDFMDFISGGFLSFIFSIIFSLIIWIWLFGKVGFIQKRLIRKYALRWAIALIVGIAPFIAALIPEAAILVYLGYRHEKKIVKDFLESVSTFSDSNQLEREWASRYN